MDQEKQTFVFDDISSPPVPSLLRGFTSPVKLNTNITPQQLKIIFSYDDDPFNRWEAGQQLFQHCIVENTQRIVAGKECRFDHWLIELIGTAISNPEQDSALVAKLISLPGESWLAEMTKPANPWAIFNARQALQQKIAATHMKALVNLYTALQQSNDGSLTPQQMGLRSLRDVCLQYLASLDLNQTHQLAESQLEQAINMTDKISAITAIASSTAPDRDQILHNFYELWQQEPLVVDKWFRIQATVPHSNTLFQVKLLCQHPAFDYTNPNKVYALILAFTHANPVAFHRPDGAGYSFVTNWVTILDPVNPQVSARLVSALVGWRNYIPQQGLKMRAELEKISNLNNLSSDVSELTERALEE